MYSINQSAVRAWDGTITVDEYIALPVFGKGGAGMLKVRAFTHKDSWEIDETLKREYSEAIKGRIRIGGFAMPVENGGMT